jgi:hypothetical protein
VSSSRSDADTSLVTAGIQLFASRQRCRATTNRQRTHRMRAQRSTKPTMPRHLSPGPSVYLTTARCGADWLASQPSYHAVDIDVSCGTFAPQGGHASRKQAWRFSRHPQADRSQLSARVRRRSTRERHHDAHEVRSTGGGERSQRPDPRPPISQRGCRIPWIHRSAMDPSARRWLSACGD